MSARTPRGKGTMGSRKHRGLEGLRSLVMAAALLAAAPLGLAAQGAAAAQASPAASAPAAAPSPADRFQALFDRTGDEGKLVARFVKMSLVTESEEKSGDCAILTSPEGLVMLVDAGAPECAEQVERCLDAMGVARLDAIMASHPHVDHIGGFARLLEKYSVGRLYTSRLEYPTAVFRGFMAAVKAKGIEVIYLEEGSAFSFGERVRAEVLNPEPEIRYYEGYPKNGTQFVNDRSLVVKFAYGASSMLFMGDVYTPREAELVAKYGERLKADLVKVGHHGADTSSSKGFARAVSPKLAVMMHDNLASLQVYKNWRKVGSAAYVTCIDGSVKVAGDEAGNWSVLTQSDRQSDFLP